MFTPSAPARDATTFAGRTDEQRRLTSAILERGRHGVVYGSRGVGKTSLANVVSNTLTLAGEPATRFSARVGCTRDDDFDGIWRRILGEVSITPIPGAETIVAPIPFDGIRNEMDVLGRLDDDLEPLTPPTIERLLRNAHRAVFVFDELDTVEDSDTRREFAETIKQLSDVGSGVTIVLIGVGRDVGSLIESHESVQRCLEQISMPLMEDQEIETFLRRGFEAAGLRVDEDAVDLIAWFSRGFPAFAHSLAKRAAELSVDDDLGTVTPDQVFRGAIGATESVPYSLGSAYDTAVDRKHPSDTTGFTLAAAAWLGEVRFRPTEVLRMLESWNMPRSLPTVTGHLKRLASVARAEVLTQHGDDHPWFEFRDPMMAPYVMLRNAHLRAPHMETDDEMVGGLP